MSSYTTALRINQRPNKRGDYRTIVAVVFLSGFGYILLLCGSIELYKSNTFIECQCQIKSIGIKKIGEKFHPHYNITVINGDQKLNDVFISSISESVEKLAWAAATRRYHINETFTCYGAKNRTAVIKWGWQLAKPSKVMAYGLLFVGMTLVIVAAVFGRLKQCFQDCPLGRTNTQQQTRFRTLLRSEDQQQPTALLEGPPPPPDSPSPESPPPNYEEAVKILAGRLTIV